MKVLVIDDDHSRQEDFKLLFDKTYPDWEVIYAWDDKQALAAFKEHKFDIAFFDHDLGFGSESGSHIAFQVLSNPKIYKAPKWVWVHSNNSVGARNISAKFDSLKIPCVIQGFDHFMLGRLKDREYFEEVYLAGYF